MRRLFLACGIALLAAGTSPAYADFDDWLKGLMDAPGLHAGRHYRDAKPAKDVDPLKLIRNQMVSGDKVTLNQLRQLASSGDDLAAYNLAKRIEEEGDATQLPTAISYYAQAVKGGRNFAVRPIVRLLDAGVATDDPELLASTEALLVDKAIKDTFVRDALIRMYRAGKPFGAYPERADQLLVASAEAGDTKAALDLAFALLTGVPDATEIERAKGYLKIAATSQTLNIRTMAENVLRTLEPQLTASTETVQ